MSEINGARIDRRYEDGQELLVLIVVAASTPAETKRLIDQAKIHVADINRETKHIHHIELQIPQALNTEAMRRSVARLASNLKSV